jgi:mannose-6-phosphate isomerase-like protein (cupin superfamily)
MQAYAGRRTAAGLNLLDAQPAVVFEHGRGGVDLFGGGQLRPMPWRASSSEMRRASLDAIIPVVRRWADEEIGRKKDAVSEANEGAGGIKHVRPGEGTSLWFFGGLVTFYALGEDTGGAFTLLEEATEPGSAAFPHLHHEEDQAFYILQGNHEFVCDGETFMTKPGSFVYIPRGMVHSFTNVGTTPGKIMVLSTPAGGTERFFFELGEPATDTSSPPPSSRGPESMDDIAQLKEIAQKHGSDIDSLALLQQMSTGNPPSEQEGR